MKNQKTKIEKEIKKALSLLTDDQKKMIDDVIRDDFVYDSVIVLLNIPADDHLQRNLIYGVLVRQTRNHLVFAIWNNLSGEQSKHLRDFVNQVAITEPGVIHENVMMEFVQLYPDLMEKVYESLSGFFKDFIEKFNEINGA